MPSISKESDSTDVPQISSIRVWDVFVRVFHWSLILLIGFALFSHGGLLGVHRLAGYCVAAFVVARLVWGFIGSEHARFASFVPTPRVLFRYLGQLLRGRETRMLGHNPAGAVMVLALLAVLIAIIFTGLMLDTNHYRDHRPLHAWHDGLTDALLVLGAIHIAGVIYTSIRHRDNLVRAMFTGRKRLD